jgi:hypothetical protein
LLASASTVDLVLQRAGVQRGGVVVQLLLGHRLAARFLDGGDQRVAVRLARGNDDRMHRAVRVDFI